MRFISVVLFFALWGAGCLGREAATVRKKDPPAWKIPRERIALVTEAEKETGVKAVHYDGPSGRKMMITLAPTFKDGSGQYTTNVEGERIMLQIGSAGRTKEDRMLFGRQTGLTRFEDGSLAGWLVTAAYDETNSRWIVRASADDTEEPELMHHVIECIGTKKSDNIFWNGCRTAIEDAQVMRY